MNKERLLNVARALRESPNPEMFTMAEFVHPCGTPACALGHYGMRPDLQDAYRWNEKSRALEVFHASPGVSLFRNAEYHFDLERRDAEELFDSNGCGDAKTAIEAAEYIEAFVARHEVAS